MIYVIATLCVLVLFRVTQEAFGYGWDNGYCKGWNDAIENRKDEIDE